MSGNRRTKWGKWAAAIAGGLVLIKGTVVVGTHVFAFAKGEVEARGGDVNFVLRLADRHKGG